MQRFIFVMLVSSIMYVLEGMEGDSKTLLLDDLKKSYEISPPGQRRNLCAQILFLRQTTNRIIVNPDHQEIATIRKIEEQKRIKKQEKLR
jgi:hypothetical protein